MSSANPVAVFGVVLADDDELILEALTGLLDDHPGLTVVGSAGNGVDAAELCRQLGAHLAVLDVMMPSGGVEGLLAVRAASPDTEVVFYTAQADRRTAARLVEAGALAVFQKGGSIDLAEELHAVIAARFPTPRSEPLDLHE